MHRNIEIYIEILSNKPTKNQCKKIIEHIERDLKNIEKQKISLLLIIKKCEEILK